MIKCCEILLTGVLLGLRHVLLFTDGCCMFFSDQLITPVTFKCNIMYELLASATVSTQKRISVDNGLRWRSYRLMELPWRSALDVALCTWGERLCWTSSRRLSTAWLSSSSSQRSDSQAQTQSHNSSVNEWQLYTLQRTCTSHYSVLLQQITLPRNVKGAYSSSLAIFTSP